MMTNHATKNSIMKMARLSGVLYLLIAVCGGFAFFAGYENLLVAGDSAATATNIMASESIFRIGFAGDALTFLGEIILTILLYHLFKPVNKTLSQMAAFSRLAMTAMIGMNLLNKLIVLHLLNNAEYAAVFTTEQQHALVNLFMTAYGLGSLIWGIFFGLHLFLIGYLIFNSSYFPRLLGALFVFASFGYFIDSFGNLLLPQFEVFYNIIILSTIPAELAFAFWLLMRGINLKQWQKRTLSAA